MKSNTDEQRLREIEQTQATLRASIDDTRRLSEQVRQLLEKRRPPPQAE